MQICNFSNAPRVIQQKVMLLLDTKSLLKMRLVDKKTCCYATQVLLSQIENGEVKMSQSFLKGLLNGKITKALPEEYSGVVIFILINDGQFMKFPFLGSVVTKINKNMEDIKSFKCTICVLRQPGEKWMDIASHLLYPAIDNLDHKKYIDNPKEYVEADYEIIKFDISPSELECPIKERTLQKVSDKPSLSSKIWEVGTTIFSKATNFFIRNNENK